MTPPWLSNFSTLPTFPDCLLYASYPTSAPPLHCDLLTVAIFSTARHMCSFTVAGGASLCDSAVSGKQGYWTVLLSHCNHSALMEFTKTSHSGWIASVMHGSKSHSLSTYLCSEWWERVVRLVMAQGILFGSNWALAWERKAHIHSLLAEIIFLNWQLTASLCNMWHFQQVSHSNLKRKNIFYKSKHLFISTWLNRTEHRTANITLTSPRVQ